MGKPLFPLWSFVWWHDIERQIIYENDIYKYPVDITMDCMVVYVTEKYTEL